ncbi:MAG TPA: glycosyltransferase family 1 protein [Verrucomicrobiae bacterium]|nr:glycosyltransferase family 1 protein [Verrucomicrobiae bacterium]
MKPLAIVAGYIVRYPLGGHVLAELNYLRGFQQLGFEVVFVEEARAEWSLCFDPIRRQMTTDPSAGLAALQRELKPLDLDHSWCFVDARGQWHGMTAAEFRGRCRRATLLLSRSNVTWLEEFRDCPVRVCVDTDPGFTQFRLPDQPTPSIPGYASAYDFQHHFSYGERIGKPDCPIPTLGFTWWPTRAPIALDLMPMRFTPAATRFTTVMSWGARAPIEYRGETYGQKDIEFLRVMELPARVGPIVEIALAGDHAPRAEIEAAGWRLVDPVTVTATVDSYRDYLAQSRGEFSVAVNLEVKTRSGWFSDRTAAYLAAGKPVVVQDTGFSEFLPCGEGLFAFATLDEATTAIESIQGDYPRHCRTARRIAEEYFDARKVVGKLLEEIGV